MVAVAVAETAETVAAKDQAKGQARGQAKVEPRRPKVQVWLVAWDFLQAQSSSPAMIV